MGLMAGGAVVSSLLAGAVRLPPTLGVQICSILILSGLSLSLLLVSQSAWATAIGVTLFGLFNAPLTIWAQTLRMQIIPEPLRGRTFALLRMLMQSANPVGGLSAGPLVPAVGMLALIGMSALFVGVPGVLGLRVTQLRTMRD
jgi:hypothetical protein